MKKKAKLPDKMIPPLERSFDSHQFFIPKITKVEDKVTMRRTFVSSIFGHKTKDSVAIPKTEVTGDLDKKYDPFRINKKLTKKEMMERYGSAYYEFPTFGHGDKSTILNGQYDKEYMEKRKNEEPTQPETPAVVTKPAVSDQVSLSDFFGNTPQEPTVSNPKTIDPDEEFVFKLDEEDGLLDANRFGKLNDEDEETEDLLFGQKKNETGPEIVITGQSVEEENQPKKDLNLDDEPAITARMGIVNDFKGYVFPPLTLLKKAPPAKVGTQPWIQDNIDKINATLLAFGIQGEVSTYTKGPTVTRYEIMLQSGVATKRITGIAENIQMSLAAVSIRIEAPIPGKTTVGIEVPNKERDSVFFGDIVDNPKFIHSKDPLLLAIGLDIDANPVYTSIEAMPHGLVAGSTQSGKSVAIASIIASLLYRNRPDEVKLMLIDPKKVDLQQFADIPHLVTPIIDDAKTAVEGLKWAVTEMERRYDVLKKFRSVNVSDYYERRKNDRDFEKMPRLVIIVEEASDLLISGGPEVEDNILKLTQKSRAVGIHLILATQRPSADIIKGSIKANIPTRFAFRVPSLTDSQVILDQPGAEKLLGKGDMLLSENGLIRRLQGAFLSPTEIETLTEFIKKQAYPQYLFTHESLLRNGKGANDAAELDDLFADVAKYIVTESKCSLNKISQEFGIGFNRAVQIVNSLELYNIVAPNAGTKPREVLVNDVQLLGIIAKLKLK